MSVKAGIPGIPSADLEKSLNFWVSGLGLIADRHMWQEGRLVGCRVHNENLYFWLNQRAGQLTPPEFHGISLYWPPENIETTRDRLKHYGFEVSEIKERDYGQTEFFVTDDDGHSHCFGVATKGR